VVKNTLASRSLTRRHDGRKEERFQRIVMTVVIQHLETRQFLAGRNEWVADPHDALTFSDTRHAVSYCRRHTLESVRFVVFLKNRVVSLLIYVPGSDVPQPAGVIKHAA
jgi:hypothetical protein